MKNQIVGAEGQSTFYLPAKRSNRLFQEQRSAAGEIHQIVHMDCHGLEIIFFAQAHHFVALRTAQFVWRPLARTGGEYLEGIASQPIGAFCSVLDTPGARGVNANTARGQARRALWSSVVQDV